MRFPPSLPGRSLTRLRRAVLLRRRTVAALLAGSTVLLVVVATDPPPPRTVPVVVAARDLPATTRLTTDDLRLVDVTHGTAPDSALTSPRGVLGRRLAVGLRRGEPLGRHRLAGSDAARSAPGLTPVPVRFADGVGLVRAGDRLDLVGVDGQGGAATVARGLPVLGTGGSAGRVVDPGGGGDVDGLVLLGVPAAQVDAVVGASAAGSLLFTFSPDSP